MNENHKELISIGLTLSIVGLALFIVHRFIPSLIWASILGIATYPLYRQWRQLFGKWENTAAFLFTFIMVLILLVPLSGLMSVLIKEVQLFFTYLQSMNRHGGHAPPFLHEIPFFGSDWETYWELNFAKPGQIKSFLSHLHVSLTPASYYIKQVGADLAHRSFQMSFTLLSLFFCYRDGDRFFVQLNNMGSYCLGERWFRYADKLPAALRATVNGTMVVGAGVGLLMGGCYALVGFPAPTLVGFITAFGAMIPFVVPLVFGVVALILLVQGSMIAGVVVIVWGTLVMFIADHVVKPALIGGATQLPFLAVLFGILGGVETLGLLGLFVGPMIMVFFITLWSEAQPE